MNLEQPKFNPKLEKSRIIAESELLKRGAEYSEEGQLILEKGQAENIKIDEAIEQTEESIEDVKSKFDNLFQAFLAKKINKDLKGMGEFKKELEEDLKKLEDALSNISRLHHS